MLYAFFRINVPAAGVLFVAAGAALAGCVSLAQPAYIDDGAKAKTQDCQSAASTQDCRKPPAAK